MNGHVRIIPEEWPKWLRYFVIACISLSVSMAMGWAVVSYAFNERSNLEQTKLAKTLANNASKRIDGYQKTQAEMQADIDNNRIRIAQLEGCIKSSGCTAVPTELPAVAPRYPVAVQTTTTKPKGSGTTTTSSSAPNKSTTTSSSTTTTTTTTTPRTPRSTLVCTPKGLTPTTICR